MSLEICDNDDSESIIYGGVEGAIDNQALAVVNIQNLMAVQTTDVVDWENPNCRSAVK